MENDAAWDPALLVQLGFHLPRLRDRRFSTASFVAAWGVAGLLSSALVPGLASKPVQAILYFLFLMAGVLLLLLAVAAPDLPVAERAAARLEGWIGAMLYPLEQEAHE